MLIEIILTVFACLVLALISGAIGYALGADKKSEALRKLSSEILEMQKHAATTAEKNRELMKQLNKKENVSRETSYNKSYGVPEVMDYYNKQFPPMEDEN